MEAIEIKDNKTRKILDNALDGIILVMIGGLWSGINAQKIMQDSKRKKYVFRLYS